jgi:Cu(I)/Ag(I) efflux system protein CusF
MANTLDTNTEKLEMKKLIATLMILASAAAFADTPSSSGEVKQVDKATGKLTIKHGPLANLDMPAMTMVFKAKDPALLDKVKPGDKIEFVAERVNGALQVSTISVVK